MSLNISNWKNFKIGKLFTMLNGKGITQEEILENQGTLIAVQSGEENNGVMGYIDLEYCKQMNYTYTLKQCLTVARSGSAGFVSFQARGCVVGDSAKILLLPEEIADRDIYLFIQTVLIANRFKYNYGRKVTEDKYLNDWIKLPIMLDKSGNPLLDSTHKYSSKGYVPNWNFMKEYIQSLHHKEITTNNKYGQNSPLNLEVWKEFCLKKLFKVKKAHAYNQETFEPIEEPINKLGCITRTSNNNGLDYYGEMDIDLKIEEGNALTIGGEGVVCFYQPEQFVCGTNMTVLRNEKLNKYNGLFISTVIDYYSKDRFSYGRAFNKSQIEKSIIKLPAIQTGSKKYRDDGYEPDWQYMEDYIKSLPYGDRLEG